jgi:endonuclease/exonuclease/phosphatase family metal-dependent hydrolase
VRVLHWNVHMWRTAEGESNHAAVADLIRRTDPDVVSLVEVDEPWGRAENLSAVADELGYAWVFVPAFEYRTKGGFGNALLTRTPLSAVHQWQLLSPRLYDGTEPTEPRAALLGRIVIDEHVVWVGSTHLPRRDPAMRAEASGRLLGLLDGLGGPCVVCGDFNQAPEDWLANGLSTAPSPAVPTYPADAPRERIDYCLLTGAVGEAQTMTSLASDHLPVLADVTLGAAG